MYTELEEPAYFFLVFCEFCFYVCEGEEKFKGDFGGFVVDVEELLED